MICFERLCTKSYTRSDERASIVRLPVIEGADKRWEGICSLYGGALFSTSPYSCHLKASNQ